MFRKWIASLLLPLGFTAGTRAAAPTTAPVTMPTTAFTQTARPNMLLMVADDLCWRDTGFTGNPDVQTPNLNRLRSEGLLLRQMYSPASTCTPTRSALLTGLYNVRSGAYPNHSNVLPGTRSLFTYLRSAGYRVALQNKADVRPAASFPFEYIEGADEYSKAREFITRDLGQPWLLDFGSNDPHDPWTRGPRRLYDPAKLTVPPYLHDNAVTRKNIAAYYAAITKLDMQVGALLDLLEETDQINNTLVMFVSEQGSSFPYGGKWTAYENGIRSAAVVRWPGHIKANGVTDAMMQYVDVVPTFLAAAGIDPTKLDTGCPDATGSREMDGRSFLDVMLGRSDKLRDVIFAQHTAMGVYGTIGPFPVRTAATIRYQYIRCLAPKYTFSINGWRLSKVLQSWTADAQSDFELAKRVDQLYHPPVEALYDLSADPYELKNIVNDPSLAGVRNDLAHQLDAWMQQQGDHGLQTEMQFEQHMRKSEKGDSD